MFARFVTLLPLATLAAVVAAAPNVLEARTSPVCNNGDVYCCNHKIENTQYFRGLLGGLLSGLNVNLGLECNTIAVVGALSPQCQQQTVCCQNVKQNGVVNVGCSPIAA